MKIADAHTHIFPEKIADKAVSSIGGFYHIPMQHKGYPHSLIESGEKIGVSKYLVCSTATTPKQVVSINDFIWEKCQKYPQFLGFATLHPDFEDIDGEIDRILRLGLRGVKLHPDFQQFNIDDPRAMPMYRRLAKEGLPVLFHTGDARYDYSSPLRLERVCQQLPELICIAAHFGGYNRWQDVPGHLRRPNVYFDTSSSLFALPPEQAVEMIRFLGVDRFMFGTDFPMWDHTEELARFDRLPLTEQEREQIFHGTFEQLFHITL